MKEYVANIKKDKEDPSYRLSLVKNTVFNEEEYILKTWSKHVKPQLRFLYIMHTNNLIDRVHTPERA